MIKFTITGAFLWERKPVFRSDYREVNVSSIAPDDSNGFYLGGEIWLEDSITNDMMIAHIDPEADSTWISRFGTSNYEAVYLLARMPTEDVVLYGGYR